MSRFIPPLLVLLTLASCSERPIAPPSGDGSVPFELIMPPRIPTADYLAISGVRVVTDQVIIDTLIDRTTGDLYARFITSPGIPHPRAVSLNTFPLQPWGSGDTMGLISEGWRGLGGIHRWDITDSTGHVDAVSVALVDLIDTVSPFSNRTPIRVDVPLTIRWRPAMSASDGVLVTWSMEGVPTYQVVAFDVGYVNIPADTVLRFRGENGRISLTRYKATRYASVGGRSVQVVRLAQRSFTTSISG